ncbi:MAG: exonuclease domain-containing protein [Burkholderiaceae bacterium]
MKLRIKAALAAGVLCMTLFAGIAGVAAAIWADLNGPERIMLGALLEAHAVIVVLGLAVAAGTLGFIAAPLGRIYLGGPAKLAEQARIMLGANRRYRLRGAGTAELETLAETINELADQRDALQSDVERQIRESQATLEEEKNRLAALVSELAQGIVACNLDGRILLYNNRARLQFTALAQSGVRISGLIGLGRSIFSLIDRALIDHALDNITLRLASGSQRALANFVTATRAGQLIRVQMAPVFAPGLANMQAPRQAAEPASGAPASSAPALSGYVLLLENITVNFEAESRRDQALHTLTEGSRAALANIRAAIETMSSYPDMQAAQRERFMAVLGEEIRALSERLEKNAAQHADALKARWALEEMRGADLLAAAHRAIRARLGVAVGIDSVAPALWVRADSFSLIRALASLAERLHHESGVGTLRLGLTQTQQLAELDMVWPGTATPLEVLQAWQHQPMKSGAESSALTLNDVAQRHGGEAWFAHDEAGGLSSFALLLPIAQAQAETPQQPDLAARPEYYDFALFARTGQAHSLDERALADLSYTVFDTETTGLAPDDGDEIIQLGAVRIVNLRLLRSETFDQLVDPRRRLGAASVKVHRITEDMLRGQPAIDEVLPAFHAFCEDTVLVGHNAAFDMRFLQLKESSSGVCFDQPLLDTLLLSEVIHPAQDSHRLEAIAQRLGVAIVARHHALGDALITAEVFLRMIGLLADAGIHTLREAREAAARTRFARVQY